MRGWKRWTLAAAMVVATLAGTPRAFGRTLQEEVGTGDLRITLRAVGTGMELAAIEGEGVPMLDGSSPIFTLHLAEAGSGAASAIDSLGDWGQVAVENDGTHCRITFSQPGSGFPSGLTVRFDLLVEGGRSQWSLAVSGLGTTTTLMAVDFPDLKLLAPGGDTFLIPKYSGTLLPDPVASAVSYDLTYPRGWSATMPFAAYYNADYGLYLGFHDPFASLKTFHLRGESGHLHFWGDVVIADETVPGNDWTLPGHFELDLFEGDWYDAALIYRDWASQEADYWPDESAAREQRQRALGEVAVWGYYSADPSVPMTTIEGEMLDYVDYFDGLPTGIHWYRWNYLDFDDDYPDYFPEREGMDDLVASVQAAGGVLMPYINGRLYDTDLTGEWDYATRGYPYATKQSDGTAYTQFFNGNTFAVMCPTQSSWWNILVDAAWQLTGRLGTAGVYVDQVAAAGPTECMDASHGHPLGGGHWWRDGYRAMFEALHATLPGDRFVIVEGGADYVADQVDGFLTDGWLTNNLVPAFQAVYGGRVQLVGKRTGTSRYHNESFYCKLSQAFTQGIQPGRTSLWIVHDPNADLAAPFVRQLATMRARLRDYLAFGRMLRPPELEGSIPTITSSWTDYGTPVDVTISAIQRGLYRNEEDGSIALVFANASMTDTLDFAFTFEGERYGFGGDLFVRRVTESGEETPQVKPNTFTQAVSMEPLEVMAFVITSTYTVGGTVCDLESGESLVLQNNGGDDLTITANGPFTFATALESGAAYAVTVASQAVSADERCFVVNGSGIIRGENVTDVAVFCLERRLYLPLVLR